MKPIQTNAVYFLLFLLTISCNQINKKSTTNEVIKEETSRINNLDEPQFVALSFYQWYLKDIYLKENVETPDVILNKENIYVLDATNHKLFLDTCTYFSAKFYENEKVIFKNCEDKLQEVDWKEVEESGTVNPADFVEGNECVFLSYMVWTNGQGENINKVEIDHFETKGNKSVVLLSLSDSLYGEISKAQVTLEMENNSWKITKIKARV